LNQPEIHKLVDNASGHHAIDLKMKNPQSVAKMLHPNVVLQAETPHSAPRIAENMYMNNSQVVSNRR
jgi:hypothetical protein